MSGERPCRACGAAGHPSGREGPYVELHCDDCGSTSFYGARDGHTDWYQELYAPDGEEQLPATLGRLRVRALVPVPLRAAPPPRLRTSDHLLLDAARRWTDPGDVVFDWGCGSGRLLQHLDRADRVAVGIDVSHDLVDPLNAAGLCAHVSADAAITLDGPPPRVILMAELLEHLDDAARLLADLREHYPAARLAVSVPSPRRLAAISGRLEPWHRPPEHLVRFTQEGLARLLARCGYEPGVHLPAPTGQDHVPGWYKQAASAGVSLVRVAERTDLALDRTRSFAAGLLWAHALYVRIGRVVGAVTPSRVRARRARASAESMVAFARPR